MRAKSYIIYIEGSPHRTVKSRATAERLRQKFEAEGWNVKVVAQYETVIGTAGGEV